MKCMLSVLALVGLFALAGCETTMDNASPGALSTECGSDCSSTCCQDPSLGTVSESDCAASSCSTDASLGTVSENSDCGGCPFSGGAK